MQPGGREFHEVELCGGPSHGSDRSPDRGPDRNGRYLYCIAEGGKHKDLGPIGLDGSAVYTIPHRGLCAVVHNSPAVPYRTEDQEVLQGWLWAHEAVVEAAWEIFGTVLPSGFGTVVRAGSGRGATENVEWWLKENRDVLLEKINTVRGKAEYGVRISWDACGIAAQVVAESPGIRKLQQEMRSKSPGIAYLYKQKLDKAIRSEMEARARARVLDFCHLIEAWAADLQVDRPKPPDEGGQMLINVSCLLRKEDVGGLGEVLEKIQGTEGFSVRFTGPWPPYSFVAPRRGKPE